MSWLCDWTTCFMIVGLLYFLPVKKNQRSFWNLKSRAAPRPLFSASTATSRARTPWAPRPNFTVTYGKYQIHPSYLLHCIACIKYSLPGVMHATTQFNVWASSMIRDVAHFSPPLCASEISSLDIISVRSSYFELKCGTLFSPCPILFA